MEILDSKLILDIETESCKYIVTYVRPHPHDGVQGWALVTVHRLVTRGKVSVLEQLTNEN